jgi:hypothetical protein
MSIQMSLSSVIQTRTNCLWPKSPYLPNFASLCAICTNGHLQYGTIQCVEDDTNGHTYTLCANCTDFWKCLDDSASQEYDGIEKQGIKNSLRIFLQGTEAILPGNWETLFSLESDLNHRAFSPCKPDAYNALDSAEYYTRLDSELSPGVFSNHRHCLWSEGRPVFLLETWMQKFLSTVQRLLNNLNYTTTHLKSQHSFNSFSYRLVNAESEAK